MKTRQQRARLVCLTVLGLVSAGGCTHTSMRYGQPHFAQQSTFSVKQDGAGSDKPVAVINPITFPEQATLDARQRRVAHSLQLDFAEAARRTELFSAVHAASAPVAGDAVSIDVTLKDALEEQWRWYYFWGGELEEYKVECAVRVSRAGEEIAAFDTVITEEATSSSYVFLGPFCVSPSLVDSPPVTRVATGKLLTWFQRDLLRAADAIRSLPAGGQVEVAAVESAANDYAPFEHAMPHHTVDVGIGVVIGLGGLVERLNPGDAPWDTSQMGFVLSFDYSLRLRHLLHVGALPELFAGFAYSDQSTTVKDCSQSRDTSECTTLGEDEGGISAWDVNLGVRWPADFLPFWGLFLEGGLAYHSHDNDTRVAPTNAYRGGTNAEGYLISIAEDMSETQLTYFLGGGMRLGYEHQRVQFMIFARYLALDVTDNLMVQGMFRVNL